MNLVRFAFVPCSVVIGAFGCASSNPAAPPAVAIDGGADATAKVDETGATPDTTSRDAASPAPDAAAVGDAADASSPDAGPSAPATAYGNCISGKCGDPRETSCFKGDNVFGPFSVCRAPCTTPADCPAKPSLFSSASLGVGCQKGQCYIECGVCPAGGTCHTGDGLNKVCVWKN